MSLSQPEAIVRLAMVGLKGTGFDRDTEQWWIYNSSTGLWEAVPESKILEICQIYFKYIDVSSNSLYLRESLEFARPHRFIKGLNKASSINYLAFKNGVLNLRTNLFNQHSFRFWLTWQLPYNYLCSDRPSSWKSIRHFLNDFCGGDINEIDLLLAFCSLIIKGRYRSKVFLSLYGDEISTKRVLIKLLIGLVGESNSLSIELAKLEAKDFEASTLTRTRLAVVYDLKHEYTGKICLLKKITTTELINSADKKFSFRGLTILENGDSLLKFNRSTGGFSSDSLRLNFRSYGRVEVNHFDSTMRDLFNELPAFAKHLLSLSDDWVEEVLRKAKNR
jgi:putative DNA primase/helicase